jgi:type I restriction enzyme, R subunit
MVTRCYLAPYRVYRVVMTLDATGYRPSAGETDKYGEAMPEFERQLAHTERTRRIAAYLT